MAFDRIKTPTVRSVSEAGYRFELTDLRDRPLGVFFTVRGTDSEAVRAFLGQQLQDDLQREIQARKRGREVDPKSLDLRVAEAIDLAVVATIGWENITANDTPVPFSPDEARSLYRDFSWIRAAVIREALDPGNFAHSSSPSCAPTPTPSSPSA